jgi:hypothetical protein
MGVKGIYTPSKSLLSQKVYIDDILFYSMYSLQIPLNVVSGMFVKLRRKRLYSFTLHSFLLPLAAG